MSKNYTEMQQNQHLSTNVRNYFSPITLISKQFEPFLSNTMYMRRTSYFFAPVLVVFYGLNAFGQSNITISGTLQSQEGKAIEAATVSLLKQADSSLVKVTMSEKNGAYSFDH